MSKTYLCDPARNAGCGKHLCFEHGGPCGTTDDVRCALLDLLGRPVELINEDEDYKNGGKHERQ